jgi:alpha-L-fucosidase
MPGRADGKRLNVGDRPGTHWVPAECDVSIRPGWFYHAREDGQVKTPAQLLDLYYKSVGRGASFLLNVPPDRRGLVHENDAKSLAEFGRLVRAIFAVNLADGAKASASNVRGNDGRFAAAGVLDGRDGAYWSTDDSVTTPELTLELNGARTFNVVSLREHLPLGQRVEDWALDAWIEGKWVEFAAGKAIGSRRLWRGGDVTTDKVRLRIVKAPVCPAITEFALYCEPAEARAAGGGAQGPGELARTGWKVHGVSYATPESGVAANAIDGNAKTLWHTHGPEGEKAPPQEIVLDLGAARSFKGFTYLPRSDGTTRGMVDRYELYVSDDPGSWSQPVAAGEFGNIKANPIRQVVPFGRTVTARYVRFVALHSADGNHVTVAELGLLAP